MRSLFTKNICVFLLSFLALFMSAREGNAQGTWAELNNVAPYANGGVMLLLTDGTVIAVNYADTYWSRLTPDANGSYVNGTWDVITPMNDTRLYFSSQVLQDGRVYVGGGEYGTGGGRGEIYNPLFDSWTPAGPMPVRDSIFDGNSMLLPDGTVLQALVKSDSDASWMGRGNLIYDPVTNLYKAAPNCKGGREEASWVKLPDNSILLANSFGTTSERYIPSLGKWIKDDDLPVDLFDFMIECGPGFLLPDGRAIFFGASGHTAYYTPSGSLAHGSWAAGPDIPDGKGMPDAAGAMMRDGKILIAVSPLETPNNTFPFPTSLYEFDYLTNAYTQVKTIGGHDTLSIPSYMTNMLDLPDGNVLFGILQEKQYLIYSPAGAQLAAGKPAVHDVNEISCGTYAITGTQFNGISEGAVYGDDWQMATNYPIVRLTQGTDVYYARTFNWNSTGVQRGALPDTAQFTTPATVQPGTYDLEVIANGIASDKFTFHVCPVGLESLMQADENSITVYPNPASDKVKIQFNSKYSGAYIARLTDITGRTELEKNENAVRGINNLELTLDSPAKGIYCLTLITAKEVRQKLITIE